MSSTFLSRFLMLILFLMPFMAPIGVIEDHIFANHAHLKMTLGLIGSLTIMLLWMFKRERGYAFQVRYTKLLFIFLGFIAWEFVTLFWVQNMYLASIALIQHSSFVVIFFLAINLLSKKDMPIVLNMLVFSLVLVSIIGLMQYYFNDIDFIKNLFIQTVAPAATFVNKNMASHFMVMVLPISLVLFLFANKRSYAVLYSIAFFLGAWYVLYIQARQAYLAVIVEFLVLVLFFGLDFWKNKINSAFHTISFRKSKMISLALILGLLFVVGNLTNQGFNTNAGEKFKRLSAISVEGGGSRIPLWINTLEMIKDNPLLGVGVNQWSENYPLYYDRVAKDVAFNETTRLKRVHNEYIETLASVGIIGYIFLLWSFYLVIQGIWKSLSVVSNKSRYVVLAATLGMVGFSVVAFVSFPVQSYLPVFLLMFYFAIVVDTREKVKKIDFLTNFYRYSALLLSAMLLIYAINFTYKLLFSKHYHQKSIEHYNSKEYGVAIDLNKKALHLNPDVWSYNQFGAMYLLTLERYGEAIALLNKANSISPYNTFSLLNLQNAYAHISDLEKQKNTLKRILSFDSKSVKASSLLVQVLYIQKKYRKATIEYKRTKKNFEYFKGRNGFGPYHTILAETALLIGDYKYFGHIYDDLIVQDPTAENYVVYGIVEYQRAGNKAKAKELFNKAIEIDQSIDIPKEIRSDLEL